MHEPANASTPPPAPFATPLDAGPITADLPCSRCMYNLRGLSTESRCPECGTPVAQSLHGNWLRLAGPEWLRKLKLGAALKLWGLLLGVVLGFAIGLAGGLLGPATATTGVFSLLVTSAGLIGGILSLIATFLITSPEPTIGQAEDPVTLRKVIRLCAVAGLVGGILSERGFPGALGTAVVIIGAALSLIGVVTTFGEFCYLRRFARRIPDLKLAKRTTVVMWGFGITAAVGALAALAGIILTLLGVGPFAPGGAFTVTASGASATATSNLAAGSGPTALLTGIGAAFVGCSIGLAFLVFFIFYVGLLIQYYGAFKQAVAEAEQIARGELPPFRFGEASPPGPAQHA